MRRLGLRRESCAVTPNFHRKLDTPFRLVLRAGPPFGLPIVHNDLQVNHAPTHHFLVNHLSISATFLQLAYRLGVAAMALAIVSACAVLATRAQIWAPPPPPGAVLLDCDEVTESSGLARSRLEDDLLWTHNDSGDVPRLFAFDSQGSWRATVRLAKAKALDWEDMCSFDRDGKHYLAVADSGDNRRQRKSVVIYGVEEPQLQKQRADKPSKLSSELRFEIHVRYPAGAADCEALAYDPWRKQLILVTKEALRARIYAISFNPAGGKQETQAQQIGSVILPMVTGATVSDDGQMLALATYGPSCLLRRPSQTDWSKATSEQRTQATWMPANAEGLELVPAPPRRQGESICFDRTGTRLLMTSEGHPMPLFTVDATPVKEDETK